jgi:O-antigen/teichoic acid export membrane protein
MWYVREQQFISLACARVGQSALATSNQIGLGLMGLGPVGLITAQSINYGAAALLLLPPVLARELRRGRPDIKDMMATLRRHSAYPRYSVLDSLANTASIHIPVLIIAITATGPEAGYVGLAMFVLQVPMALIGSASAQFYLSEARRANEEHTLSDLTITTLTLIGKAVFLPMLVICIVAPLAFRDIFGAEWGRSGILVSWMVPWYFAQLLVSPVSGALHILGEQRNAMYLQLFGMTLRIGIVAGAGIYQPDWASELYALSGAIFYIAYAFVVLVTIKKHER